VSGFPRYHRLPELVYCEAHGDVHDRDWTDEAVACGPADWFPVFVGAFRCQEPTSSSSSPATPP